MLPSWELHRPFGVRPIEIAVSVHHLRFDPKPKVHAVCVNVIDQRLQSVRKLCLVHIPVPKARMIVLALPEPPVVHDKRSTPIFAARSASGIWPSTETFISVASQEL